jgi:putative DNA primase/helicase
VVSIQTERPPRTEVIAENIPKAFTRRPQWVNWRYEERDGTLTKVPYSPRTGRRASSTDLMTWASFEEVVEALEGGRYDGIGFVFCSGDPFVGIDLDKCRNAETGDVEEWAQQIIDSITDKYVEISPSGKGVHIITCGRLRGGRKKGNLEVYGQEKFLTFTGVVL